jgi:hypothetical protein
VNTRINQLIGIKHHLVNNGTDLNFEVGQQEIMFGIRTTVINTHGIRTPQYVSRY